MPTALNLSLTGPLADEVRAAAAACGLSPEEYARQVLAKRLLQGNDDPLDWAEDVRRIANYERTGKTVDAAEVFDKQEAKLKARVSEKA